MLAKRDRTHAYTDLAHSSFGKFIDGTVTADLIAERAQGDVGKAFLGISIYHIQGVRVPDFWAIRTGVILRFVERICPDLFSFLNRIKW